MLLDSTFLTMRGERSRSTIRVPTKPSTSFASYRFFLRKPSKGRNRRKITSELSVDDATQSRPDSVKRTKSYVPTSLNKRKAVKLFAPFYVDYGNSIFGNNEVEERFMDELDKSPLMLLLNQAAPFGVVNTGPFGFNYWALKLSGDSEFGWQTRNLQKNYERELMHGRWAMLAVAGVIVQDQLGNGPWFNAGAACFLGDIACNPFSFGFRFENAEGLAHGWYTAAKNFTPGSSSFISILILQLMMIYQVECYRTGFSTFDGVVTKSADGNMDSEEGEVSTIFPEFRVHEISPGGRFDPLNIVGKAEAIERKEGSIYAFGSITRLKAQELRHGRLAMLAWLGFVAQAIITNRPLHVPNEINSYEANGPFDNLATLYQNVVSCPVSIGIPGC